jgi:hypothetical protein
MSEAISDADREGVSEESAAGESENKCLLKFSLRSMATRVQSKLSKIARTTDEKKSIEQGRDMPTHPFSYERL